MRIAASWSNIAFDRIQVRAAMSTAGYCKLPSECLSVAMEFLVSYAMLPDMLRPTKGMASPAPTIDLLNLTHTPGPSMQGEESLRTALDRRYPIQVVAGRCEDGVDTVADAAFEIVA
ncbi:hypothetical protein, partial [Bradyrhizobium sp. Mp64]|uniref:hypothetical protein n=1 Tax=Bradyrhizobium sp. Mp64 TaxID=3042158 RepID=UPI00248D1F35